MNSILFEKDFVDLEISCNFAVALANEGFCFEHGI